MKIGGNWQGERGNEVTCCIGFSSEEEFLHLEAEQKAFLNHFIMFTLNTSSILKRPFIVSHSFGDCLLGRI
jgi:hypothetical protein